MKKNILFLAANPKETLQLRLDEEVREIDAGLQRSKDRDSFLLTQKWAIRPRDLRRALLDVKPHIVHFSGHGTKSGGIALENNEGQAHLVTPEAMSSLFELVADGVECVILNACYSEIQAEAIVRHINYVIGMSKEIGDKAAIEFAVGFYDALCDGKSVEIAFKFGCNAIQLEGIPENLTPILKSKIDFKSSDLTVKKKS